MIKQVCSALLPSAGQGGAGQKKQMALMKKGGYNQTYFILSNGLACNTTDKKCYVGEFVSTVDATHTNALFGN